MDIVYFILGVLAGATLYAVVGTIKLVRQVKELEDQNNDLEQTIKWNTDHVHRTIDANHDNISQEISEIYRQMDSRFDKLDHRVHQNMEAENRNIWEAVNELIRKLETKS